MKIFIDTNILISGIFFTGNESRLLSLPNIELVTSETALKELKEVVLRKFLALKVESKRIAFQEIERATTDIRIIKETESVRYLKEAANLVKGENDQKILAAVFFATPDFFITGDKHFHTPEIKNRIKVRNTKEVLKELKILH